jgi:hypothetical protein
MADFRISIDLSGIMAATENIINEQVFPLLGQAVRAVAQQMTSNWQEAVQRTNLWSGEKDKYAAGITWKSTGPFSAEVQSIYEQDEAIENGRPAYDLKQMLQTSQKTRQFKNGKKYLIIPFRHNVPGADGGQAMPASIYAQARELTPSRVTGQGTRPAAMHASVTGQRQMRTVATRSYQWGGRLPAGLAPKLKEFHATDIYASMVRFDTTTPGGGRHSSHMTFRTMMEGSAKWILPPQPGLHIAECVTTNMRPLAEKVFVEALRRTLGA